MRLSVSLEKGVEVVIPRTMSQRQRDYTIAQFVRDKQQWINNALDKLRKKSADKKTIAQCLLPETIVLSAIEQSFNVHYLPDKSSPVLYYKSNKQLEVRGNINNKAQVFSLLEDFFKDYAKPCLQQKCDQYSQKTGLPYNRLTIRAQKTRWGSCSARKNISLNYRLLFLKEDLVNYIILHELAHTRHMNHSSAYWNFLETLIPGARSLDKQVNQTANNLACWIYYKQLE